jgi:uncharacterized protein
MIFKGAGMSIKEKIEADLLAAIKSKNEELLRTLRMVKSDIMYEKTKGTSELTEEKVLEIVFRAAKKRKEAMEEFTKAGRTDLSSREEAELRIIETYLPKQLGENEVAAAVDKKIAEMGGASKKDMGRIMGILMKELKGQVDGNLVKSVLSKKLGD